MMGVKETGLFTCIVTSFFFISLWVLFFVISDDDEGDKDETTRLTYIHTYIHYCFSYSFVHFFSEGERDQSLLRDEAERVTDGPNPTQATMRAQLGAGGKRPRPRRA